MKINWILIKQISILSVFFGCIAGLLTIIPYISSVSFLFTLCFIAPVVIHLLVKYNCISLDSITESIIIGALSGFISFIAFSIIYIPLSVILIKIFSFSANYGIGLMFKHGSFFIITTVAIFMSFLSATINAFTGFLTFCIFDIIKSFRK